MTVLAEGSHPARVFGLWWWRVRDFQHDRTVMRFHRRKADAEQAFRAAWDKAVGVTHQPSVLDAADGLAMRRVATLRDMSDKDRQAIIASGGVCAPSDVGHRIAFTPIRDLCTEPAHASRDPRAYEFGRSVVAPFGMARNGWRPPRELGGVRS